MREGRVLADNRGQVFTRKIHPGEVDLRKYITNRDKYLYFDITSQAERECDTILHQDCLRWQDEARKAHFFKHGLPGYQPFLLQDGVFSTWSGETNYRYQYMSRTVHPVSTSRCYNTLPVVLLLPQHLAADTVLNFSASATYFLDPDSWLFVPHRVRGPVFCPFPSDISDTSRVDRRDSWHPPGVTTEAFACPTAGSHRRCLPGTKLQWRRLVSTRHLRCHAGLPTDSLAPGGGYLQLAHQAHNLRPETNMSWGPLDIFPVDAAAATGWRNLLFGGWWSCLEKWGKLASIFIGAYYLYVAGRWLITTLFSLKVLCDEHRFGPTSYGAWDLGQGVFPMRFTADGDASSSTFHRPTGGRMPKHHLSQRPTNTWPWTNWRCRRCHDATRFGLACTPSYRLWNIHRVTLTDISRPTMRGLNAGPWLGKPSPPSKYQVPTCPCGPNHHRQPWPQLRIL